MVGDIAAGVLIPAEQYMDRLGDPAARPHRPGRCSGLRVRETRWSTRRSATATSSVLAAARGALGSIVAAMIDGEATVGVFGGATGTFLEPRNPAFEVIDGDDAAVLGIAVSVLRNP